MLAVIGVVSLILVIVALATSAILGNVLQENLDARLSNTTLQQVGPPLARPQFPTSDDRSAFTVLQQGRQAPGVLLIVQSPTGVLDGAVVDSQSAVVALTDDQVHQIVEAVSGGGAATASVEGHGSYRLQTFTAGNYIGIVGLPLTEVNATIAQILTTVLAVTAGGLIVLALVIALVIRVSLRPLRAVADTATRVAAVPMSQGAVSIAERVPDDQADDRTEIGRVGAALNTLLDHVDASLDERQLNEERMRRFVADASHELRTPLASIRGYSELSLRDPTLSETSESALERIQAQSIRMTSLVEDLLLLARLDEGQELVYGSVDLTKLAIEAVDDARPAGLDHNWVIDVGDQPIVIAGDTARLHQVAVNLLANARTHTPAGTTVTVTLSREDGHASLRVHDDGPGVDPDVAPELFERFARADRSRARKTGGTGLGLSIARAIVEAHHGTLSVQSVPGDTTFTVTLPARPADPASPIDDEPTVEAADAEAADTDPTESTADTERPGGPAGDAHDETVVPRG
ncbi:HAMP domain-containing protein [Microbacterium rhizomatis]|uniref:histidine kinase n=2 Tax=Microbacterium rhizomatis TaxID=1631477 RepID=A0A5J5J048_9MICO|nr:ATP-binding protein [Microbacterium rhizomatis]KAA9105694.1 HAMP domain-containing protein [Microbacterium rhizomatis]